MIKLIVADMDGTLVNDDKLVDDYTIKVIIEAQKKGCIFAIATGRSYWELNNIDKELLLDKYNGYVISANGQRLFDYANNVEHVEAKIPYDVCRKIFNLSLDYNMASYGQIENKKFYYQGENYYSKKANRMRGLINFDKKTNFFDDNRSFDKLGFYTEDDKMSILYERILNEVKGDFDIYMVNETCLDVVGKGVNKLNQIKKICEEHQIENHEVLVLGDGQNDLDMLTHYKYGVAMANSLTVVKQQVNYLTSSNNEAGVARAIERFVLKKRRAIKLIVSDMDGTLLNSQHGISEKNLTYLIKAQETGIKLALASGRSISNLYKYADLLKIKDYSGYLIGNNGQELYSYQDNSYIKHAGLDISYMKAFFNLFKGDLKLGIYLFKDNEKYIYKNSTCDSNHEMFKNLITSKLDPLTGMFEVDDYFDKIGLFTKDEDVKVLFEMIQANIKGDYEAFIISDTAIEMVGKGIDKVNKVKEIVSKEGYCEDEVLVFGDGQNDLKMLQRYPSVIMDNARMEFKEHADLVYDNKDWQGIGDFLKAYLKGN